MSKIRSHFDFIPILNIIRSNASNSCTNYNLTYFCSIKCASSTASIFILDLVTTTQRRTSFSTTIILSILIENIIIVKLQDLYAQLNKIISNQCHYRFSDRCIFLVY